MNTPTIPVHFAPLQGYTEAAYRKAHARFFGGVETYYTPFVRVEHGEIRRKDLRDTDPASWLNWQPPVPLKFRRRSEYTKEPYNPAGAVPPLYYPD